MKSFMRTFFLITVLGLEVSSAFGQTISPSKTNNIGRSIRKQAIIKEVSSNLDYTVAKVEPEFRPTNIESDAGKIPVYCISRAGFNTTNETGCNLYIMDEGDGKPTLNLKCVFVGTESFHFDE